MNTEDILHKEVVSQLVAATPEWWKFARLELEIAHEGNTDRCKHTISNPFFPDDCVEATDELHMATRNLVLYYKELESMWVTAVYDVSEGADGDWTFKAAFVY